MGYIRDFDHLINFLNKVIREDDLYIDDIPSAKEIRSVIWDNNIQDRFTWVFKNDDPSILERENMLKFATDQEQEGSCRFIDRIIDLSFDGYKFTNEYLENCKELYKKSGVYSFWQGETVLYIGVSVNLGDRLHSSFGERFRGFQERELITLKTIQSESKSNAHVIEAFMIAKLKPCLNVTGLYDDELTLTMDIPEWSHGIKCMEEEK